MRFPAAELITKSSSGKPNRKNKGKVCRRYGALNKANKLFFKSPNDRGFFNCKLAKQGGTA